jgi:hypothetical protein
MSNRLPTPDGWFPLTYYVRDPFLQLYRLLEESGT